MDRIKRVIQEIYNEMDEKIDNLQYDTENPNKTLIKMKKIRKYILKMGLSIKKNTDILNHLAEAHQQTELEDAKYKRAVERVFKMMHRNENNFFTLKFTNKFQQTAEIKCKFEYCICMGSDYNIHVSINDELFPTNINDKCSININMPIYKQETFNKLTVSKKYVNEMKDLAVSVVESIFTKSGTTYLLSIRLIDCYEPVLKENERLMYDCIFDCENY
jgi:hypothetical protein